MLIDDFVRARPGAPLRRAVAWYSGYNQRGVPPARHRGLPSPYLTLIFTLHDPLVVADGTGNRACYDALLAGLHTTPATVLHEGRQSGIQVAVSPLAARELFGVPAGELAGLDCHLDDVLAESRVEQIRARVLAGERWPQRFAVLDEELRRLPAPRREVAADVRHAWHRLRATGGRIPIDKLARETGWSARHLQARFRAEIGLTPKQAARVIRFDRARRGLAADPGARLAALAAHHGYADQSHLDRDFRGFAGCPPTTWLAEEFRNIQGGHWTPPPD